MTEMDKEAGEALVDALENAKSKDQLARLLADFLWMEGKGPSTPELKDAVRVRYDNLVDAARGVAQRGTMGDCGRLVIAALRLGRRLP
jgi:hypothetical protein